MKLHHCLYPLSFVAVLVLVGMANLQPAEKSLVKFVIGTWGPTSKPLSKKPLFNQFRGSPTIWTADDSFALLTARLNLSEPCRWNGPEDSIYIAPTQEDLDDLFTFIRHRRENLGYIPEGNDCDDASSEAKYWATVWSVRRYSRTQGALLFGKAYVHLHGCYDALFPRMGGQYVEGYHVLNFVVRSDNAVFFFEPQTGLLVPVEGFIYEDSLTVLKLEY